MSSDQLCDFVPTPYLSSFPIDSFQRPDTPRLWDIVRSFNGRFHNEAAFAHLVFALLLDVINAIPFFRLSQNQVDVLPEMAVGGRFPDAIVLKRRGDIPFFVVEIKKPGIFNLKRNPNYIKLIYGQMYDYLLDVQNEYGVSKPYGLLTTFNEFRICWLPEDKTDRILRVSDVLWKIDSNHSTSLEALGIIANALIEAFNSRVIPPVSTNASIKSCKIFRKETMAWGKINVPLVFKFPVQRTVDWFIKTTFDQGAEGKAYHVFNSSGRQAVLKFILRNQHHYRVDEYLRRRNEPETEVANVDENEKELLIQECEYWRKINGITLPCIIRANTKWALLMPYLEPLTKSEKLQFLDQESDIFRQISSIFDVCVEQGFYQTDASWRHVGWFKYSDTPVIKLLDFGHIERFECNDGDKKREVKNAMLSELHGELERELERELEF